MTTFAAIAPAEPGPDDLVLEGLAHHQVGRLTEAKACYAQALAKAPGHADALNLSGAVAFALGDHAAAIRLIGRSVEARPEFLDAYLNLAEVFEAVGRQDEAVDICREALRLAPDFAEGHARLARLFSRGSNPGRALPHSRVALALDPDSSEALAAAGLAFRRTKRFAEAEQHFTRALALAPQEVSILADAAALLNELDRPAEAETLYRRALDVEPQALNVLMALGEILEREGAIADALAIYDRALEVNPKSASILVRRGACLRDEGDFPGAEAACRQALALDRDHTPASLVLMRINRLEGAPTEIKRLTRLATDLRQPTTNRVQAGFVLGDLADRSGDPDTAFGHYASVNKLYREHRTRNGQVFDREALQSQVEVAGARIPEYVNNTGAWGHSTDQPVFVVGMPRSGTTLVEQICASHSQVFGAGELWSIRTIDAALTVHNGLQTPLKDWDAGHARMLADRHAAQLERLGRGARRVIDKAPLNLLRLGLISALFPNARVIWCRRDPRDIVVSNHTLFFDHGNLASTDLADAAFEVGQVQRLGDRWAHGLPLPILQVSYEDLVADLEINVRRIIDFLGLPWEPTCLDFKNAPRHVSTPSSWQVRQPIYSSSVGRWRRYEKHLGPMLAELARYV